MSKEQASKGGAKHNNNSFVYSHYIKLLQDSLRGDLVTAIFIFGWALSLLAVEILSFQFGRLTAQFYEILPERSRQSLTSLIIRFGLFLVMMALGKGCLFGVKGLLSRAIRKNLTRRIHSRYVCLKGLRAVAMESNRENSSTFIDHPDQRITEDIEEFSLNLLQILEVGLLCPVLIVFYNVQLNSKLGALSVSLIYCHFLISFLVLRMGMRTLRLLTVKKEQRGADLRAEHVSLASNSESFFLIQSKSLLGRLQSNLNEQLRRLLFTSKHLILMESLMELGKSLFTYSGALLNFLLLAAELTWGRWKSETDIAQIAALISMTSFLSLYLIFNLSRLVGAVDLLGVLNGQVQRLGQLINALERNERENEEPTHDSTDNQAFSISFQDFNCCIYNTSALYRNCLNFKIEPGQHTLILGKNGTGKTSIARFISGLWRSSSSISNGSSTLNCFGPSSVTGSLKISISNSSSTINPSDRPFLMTCPQNPVIFSGTLFDLLALQIDPNEGINSDEESNTKFELERRVMDALKAVGLDPFSLEDYLTNPQSINTWQTILSPGQHQRLSLARVILHRPHLLVLDETFLSMKLQEATEIINHLCSLGITLIYIDPSDTQTSMNVFKQTITINEQ